MLPQVGLVPFNVAVAERLLLNDYDDGVLSHFVTRKMPLDTTGHLSLQWHTSSYWWGVSKLTIIEGGGR